MWTLLLIVLSYCIGSIPTSIIAGKVLRGINIRIDTARKFRVLTAEYNRFIEVLRFPPTAGDISILYGTQHGVEPLSFVFFISDVKKIKNNVVMYVERRLRREYGFEGTPIKLTFKHRK